ncbi:S1/P1 nuclease [Pararcticibacter amylolyticus]|uniref:S1/P1 Nuclease n=1 Tax=Pararcticibacter amylolyticus TaxID=2173175 RepID=A0A2U2PMB2_9SPHI|nr:S1/P1 nuclease [Pararcticibacter amylolyticus]PWG82536.1 S1/P1 Nuclease [Pararcticibacter amylolyticus]
MKKLKILLVAILFLYLPLHSMAWGLLGHRIVGEIAGQHLTSKARKEIQKIFGAETLAMNANWMDFIKSDPSFKYLDVWHYVNLPQGLTAEQVDSFLKTDTAANAFNKIRFVAAELRKKTLPMDMKRMYLRILVHVMGDIHQPMHCGRREDRGGNDVKIKWFNKPSNLHTFWDSEFIEFQQLSYTEYAKALDHPTKEQVSAWQKTGLNNWIFESYQISEQLYEEAEKDQSFSYRYNFDHIDTLNEQLLKGGIRLAGLLNEIFS